MSRVRTFACGTCGQQVFFENTRCLRCGSALGVDWPSREVVTASSRPRCANAEVAACNGLVDRDGQLCFACALTRTRPNDDDEPGLAAFREAEAAKRWLLFGLGELGLPVDGLTFDLLSSVHEPVTTGHADGVVTLDLWEADDAHREEVRRQMGEPYRTLLGHLRHEVGHWYFTVLVGEDPERLHRVRALMGDETGDYQAALDRHYAQGAPLDWSETYVSAYATMHPAEDWAETFAHYLHLRDTLQTAAGHRVRVLGPEALVGAGADRLASVPRDIEQRPFDALLDEWLPLTYALNALNASMGRPPLYPFVLPAPVVDKLALVHELVLAGPADAGS